MTRTLSAGDDLAAGFAVVDGTEAVRQRVVQRLRLSRGEAFMDAEAGVPYLLEILGRRIPSSLAGELVAAEVRKVPGVANVANVDVSFNRTTRHLRITADVTVGEQTTAVDVTL